MRRALGGCPGACNSRNALREKVSSAVEARNLQSTRVRERLSLSHTLSLPSSRLTSLPLSLTHPRSISHGDPRCAERYVAHRKK